MVGRVKQGLTGLEEGWLDEAAGGATGGLSQGQILEVAHYDKATGLTPLG